MDSEPLPLRIPTVGRKGYFIYALKLRHGKYYVGSTRHIDSRLREHYRNTSFRCSWWVKEHRVLLVHYLEQIRGIPDLKGVLLREKELTETYASQFGWENVRGGPYIRDKTIPTNKRNTP